MSHESDDVRLLERLADALPAREYALVLTRYTDAPPCLSVPPREHPARNAAVVVQRAAYVAHTGGGAFPMADVGCPRSATEALVWTLTGR